MEALARVDFTGLNVFDAEGDYLTTVDGYVIVDHEYPRRAHQLMIRVHGRTLRDDLRAWGYMLHLDLYDDTHPVQMFLRRVEPFAVAYFYLAKALTR